MKRRVLFLFAVFTVLFGGHVAAASEASENTDAGTISSKDGRVGVNTSAPAATLDVYKGEIKISSSGAACTKELAGMLRFADDRLQVCNSRGWQFLSVDAPKP